MENKVYYLSRRLNHRSPASDKMLNLRMLFPREISPQINRNYLCPILCSQGVYAKILSICSVKGMSMSQLMCQFFLSCEPTMLNAFLEPNIPYSFMYIKLLRLLFVFDGHSINILQETES